ncbi:hypothetical protein EDD86DRAFT_244979 [Gorgonomyces haynaldii]|nr:hypothetical protein EDD86DRAFT_244979 [Gorgonomyces haynaldii]
MFKNHRLASHYAPFSSLTPRVSYFEELISNGPSPGAYDGWTGLEVTHPRHGGAVFGHSQTKRFSDKRNVVPGPGAYMIPSTVGHDTKPASPKKVSKAIWNQFPVGVYDPEMPKEEQSIHELMEEGEHVGPAAKKMPITDKHGYKIAPDPQRLKMISSIVWKRKYIPPSIPVGQYAYGYQENGDGDLDQSALITSFAEQAKRRNKGFKFTSSGERAFFKIQDSPGPNAYNPTTPGYEQVANAALMTLAPCKRMTDVIVSEAMKMSVPGPGAYDLKAPLQQKLNEPRNRIKLEKDIERSYLNQEHAKFPGPSAYYPEYSVHPKPKSFKPQPFGSTTKRFESPSKLSQAPAVGAYEISKVESIGTKKQRQAIFKTKAVFGAAGARFVKQTIPSQPGPGAYNISVQGKAKDERPKSRIMKLVKKGPGGIILGEVKSETVVAAPVFELPPPGTYDVDGAFHHLKTKGRVLNTGTLHSNSQRVLFKGERFKEQESWVPGPGFYDTNESSLIKKTHNITLTEWHQDMPQPTKQLEKLVVKEQSTITSFEIQDQLVYYSTENQIKRLDQRTEETVVLFETEDEVNSIDLSKNKFIAYGDDSGQVGVVDVAERKLFKRFRTQHDSIAMSQLFSGGLDGKLRLWDFSRGQQMDQFDFLGAGASMNPPFVYSLVQKEALAVGTGDGCVHVFKPSNKSIQEWDHECFESHAWAVTALDFKSDILVSGGLDKKLIIHTNDKQIFDTGIKINAICCHRDQVAVGGTMINDQSTIQFFPIS